MGSVESKRCLHCQVVYDWWWGSGRAAEFAKDPDNDDEYCKRCHKAIREALEVIPQVRERVRVETDKYTCADLDSTPEPTDLPPKPKKQEPLAWLKKMSESGLGLDETEDICEACGTKYKRRIGFHCQTLAMVEMVEMKPLPDGPYLAMLDRLAESYKNAPIPEAREYRATEPRPEFLNEEIPDVELPRYNELDAAATLGQAKGVLTKKPTGLIQDLMSDKPSGTHAPYTYAVKRFYMPLYDLEDPYNENKIGECEKDGVRYRWEWWTRTGKAAGKVFAYMEKDLITGEILGPWKDYRT